MKDTFASKVQYYVVQLGAAKVVQWLMTMRALMTGKVFYCKALAGRANYDVTINSDLTVSCSCQDRDATGNIGSVANQTLEQVFAGPKAMEFRRKLALGHLPISWCTHCPELSMVPKLEAAFQLSDFHVPNIGLSVETCNACNLACTSCNRAAMERHRGAKVITLEDIEWIAEQVSHAKLLYVFKLGEPFLTPATGRLAELVKKRNPAIRIIASTNGIPLGTKAKIEDALKLDLIFVSIDGVSTPMVEKYQHNHDFERAYENMAKLVEERNRRGQATPVIVWKYVLFRWNDRPEYLERAVQLAQVAKVDYLCVTPTTSPPWGTSLRYYLLGKYRDFGEQTDVGAMKHIAVTPKQEAVLHEIIACSKL